MASLINDRLSNVLEVKDKEMITLSSIAGAMGAIFPTPVLGVLMIQELGKPPK